MFARIKRANTIAVSACYRCVAVRYFPFHGQRFTVEEAVDRVKNFKDITRGEPKVLGENASYELSITVNRAIKAPLRRTFAKLPHGTGNPMEIAAMTNDEELAKKALEVGAMFAGDLEDDILTNKIAPKRGKLHGKHKAMKMLFRKVIATKDHEYTCCNLSSQVYIILKRFEMVPVQADKTLVKPSGFIESVKNYASGHYVPIRMSKTLNIPIPIGKVKTHTVEQIVENFHAAMEAIYKLRPNAKKLHRDLPFISRVYLGASQMRGVVPTPIDARVYQVEGRY